MPTSPPWGVSVMIRLDVSSSNFPRFDVNPNPGDPLRASAVAHVAVNTVHHDARHPSRVTLPLLDA